MEKSVSPGKSGLLYVCIVWCYNGSRIRYVHNRNICRNQRWSIVNIANYFVLPILFII
jgi:hypothetical protein